MKILGIDPGTNVTGYGLIEKDKRTLMAIAYGEIKNKRTDPLSRRLDVVYTELRKIIEDTRPAVIALEDIFFGKNVSSLIKQGHVRGVIVLAATRSGVPVYEYSPLEVKKAVVGYGLAEKAQVQQMVKTILRLPELPPPDAADALAMSICHGNSLKAVPL